MPLQEGAPGLPLLDYRSSWPMPFSQCAYIWGKPIGARQVLEQLPRCEILVVVDLDVIMSSAAVELHRAMHEWGFFGAWADNIEWVCDAQAEASAGMRRRCSCKCRVVERV